MNILLVDDEKSSRSQMADFLRKIGHQVVEKDSGLNALEAFQDGEFQLVLSDNRMPRMSGLQLLNEIRKHPQSKETAMVIFTAYGDMETAIEALRAGAYDYLLKPINVNEVVLLIERVADDLRLRSEHRLLTSNFNDAVNRATELTRQEMEDLKKAYCRVVGIDEIGVFSESLQAVIQQAGILHQDRSIPVLIEGETGTGKELLAKYVHFGGGEVTTPFVAINCATLGHNTFESELFGYEAGAFTGGIPGGKKGKIDLAEGGTLFLDEITEMPVDLQAKLLRVLQEREFYRLGGLKTIKADVRVICTSNRDLEKYVAEGKFRQDLFYRLNVGCLYIPPLRYRREEILPLARMFLLNLAKEKGKSFKTINRVACQLLQAYEWPGNVRQLHNVMEWAVLMYDDPELKPVHLGIICEKGNNLQEMGSTENMVLDEDNFSLPPGRFDFNSFGCNLVRKALEMHGGNKTKTAAYLGISRSILYTWLKRIN